MKNRRIGVVAPPYTHRSAGIHVMHYLLHQLRETGFDAYWIPQGEPLSVHQRFNTPHVQASGCSSEDIAENWIVVYPEGISGNPLNCRRVVRYLLNKESAHGGPGMNAGPTDYILTYARWFHPTAPVLHFPVFDGELLIRSGRLSGNEPRSIDAFYVGKGIAHGPCPAVAGAVEVTRTWPENKTKLYNLLENVRIFYSYDWLTSTYSDALLLGCELRLLGSPGAIGTDFLFQHSEMPQIAWERTADGSLFSRSSTRGKFLDEIQTSRAAFPARLLQVFRDITRHFDA